MLIEQHIEQYTTLNQWFQSSLGQLVAKEFKQEIAHEAPFLRGDILLQLGSCSNNAWLELLNYETKWIASPSFDDHSSHFVSPLNHLPLGRNSVDCVIAPLSVELLGLGVVDEIDRILKPMGHVVFLSLNPWSLWGGALKCRMLSSFIPHPVKMKTPFSLNRLFIQRGYQQCILNHFCYLPPLNNDILLKKLTFLDEIGKMIWPYPSGFYCYIAQKHEPIMPNLTPLVNCFTRFQPAINL